MRNFLFSDVGAVILAAGEGRRMGSTLPKVMHELQGKPLVAHVVEQVEAAHLPTKPIVVVSPKHTLVQDHLGDRADYVVQPEQLGTGHAVASAETLLRGRADQVVVLYGDMPFVTFGSIQRLIDRQLEDNNAVTLMTATVPDFADWRAPFAGFSRVIRGTDGQIERIVEQKDAIPEELIITEVNPCYFCFRADWLWECLKALKNDNAQQEYYLVDVIEQTIVAGEKIASIAIDPREALGVNTKEDLALIQTDLTH